MRYQILYVVTVEPDMQAVKPEYAEDRGVLERVAGCPVRMVNYTELAGVLPEPGPGWAVVQSGGRAGPAFPDEPVLHDADYRKLVDWEGPQLAICRSFQLVSAIYGAEVRPMPPRPGLEAREAGHYEAGSGRVNVHTADPLFESMTPELDVCQNHRNEVVAVPEGFTALASSDACPIQAWRHETRCLYGTQFHPERGGHGDGFQLLRNFFRLAFARYS